MKNYLEKIQENLTKLKEESLSISTQLRTLKVKKDVKKYLELSKKEMMIQQEIIQIEDQLLELKMMNCKHIFVKTYLKSNYDYEVNTDEPAIKCLKCNLINRVYEADISPCELSPIERKQIEIFFMTRDKGKIINSNAVKDFPRVQNLLKSMMIEHPEYDNDLLCDMIEHEINDNNHVKIKEISE